MQPHLLVVEGRSPHDAAALYAELAREPGSSCRRLSWRDTTPEVLRNHEAGIDWLVAIVEQGCDRALEVFRWLRANPVAPLVLAVVPIELDEQHLQLVVQTADDFVLRSPACIAELRHRLGRLVSYPRHGVEAARLQLLAEAGLAQLVGRDPAFVQAVEHLPRFARAVAPVLITGETGTGKELCARAVHHLSDRRSAPFVAVDCGAIPEPLFESEMFGHVRGAFTDAHRDRRGLVAMAEGGTLFLDEIDVLSPAAQAKLLRFLHERTVRAVGSERFVHADVRVIAATNRDLEAWVHEKCFRSDLFFRLNVLRVRLPPLRARAGDIELLAVSMLRHYRGPDATRPKALSAAALRRLALHDWPGNVRELSNVVQRAVVACDGDTILVSHLGLREAETATETVEDFRSAKAAAVAAFERQYVETLLRKHAGNVTHAAREARQDRRAFGRFIKKHRIDRRAL